MNGLFRNMTQAFVGIWQQIAIPQKVSIVFVALLTLAALGAVLWFGTRPDWQVLYANLTPESAAKVYELAQDENIPVRLKNSGRTIEVPASFVYHMRLRGTQEGIDVHRDGVGWELFDNLRLGMTENEQRINYQRAVQGELQRMIAEIPATGSPVLYNTPDSPNWFGHVKFTFRR